MSNHINEVMREFREMRALRAKENIKHRILSGQHARRNKEIYLAKQDGKSSKELAKIYRLHPSYISMLCRTYKIFLKITKCQTLTTRSLMEKTERQL